VSDEAVAVVKLIYEAFGRADPLSVLPLLDPDIEVEHRGAIPELAGRDFNGPEGVAEVVATVMAEFSEFESWPEEIQSNGDDVVIITMQKGVGRASGATVEKRLPQVWTVQNGKAVRWRIFKDRSEAMAAAGLVQPPPSPGGSKRRD
jgi:ketosteroid isomerase-like protein